MKNSEFIDLTIEKLTKQNAYGYGLGKNKNHTYRCQYRTSEGNSCGIGVWLTEGQAAYADDLGLSATSVRDEYPDIFNDVDPLLMERLQATHDNCAEMGLTMEQCTEKLANLKANFPD